MTSSEHQTTRQQCTIPLDANHTYSPAAPMQLGGVLRGYHLVFHTVAKAIAHHRCEEMTLASTSGSTTRTV